MTFNMHWSILLFSYNIILVKCGSQLNASKCHVDSYNNLAAAAPQIIIPPELILYETTYVNFVNSGDIYVVGEAVTSFVVTCTSNFPVDWKFNGSIGNTVVNSERGYTFDKFENGNFTRPCYYSSLIFTSVENEITGKYTCIVKPYATFDVYDDPVTNGKKEITIFSGRSALTTPNKTLTFDFTSHGNIEKDDLVLDEHTIPCAANHPAAIISLFYNNGNENSEWVLERNIFHYLHGVLMKVKLLPIHLPRRYKCIGTLYDTSEVMYITVPAFPDSMIMPRTPAIVFNVTVGAPQFFICFSKFPAVMTKEDGSLPDVFVDLGLLGNATQPTDGGNPMFKQVTQFLRYKTLLIGVVVYPDHKKVQNISAIRQVTCTNNDTLTPIMTWNYKFVAKEPIPNLNSSKHTYFIETTSQETTSVVYIIANTMAEVSLRAKCLALKSRNLCNDKELHFPVRFVGNTLAYFQTPENISGVYFWIQPPKTIGSPGNYFIQMGNGNGLGNRSTPVEEYLHIKILNSRLKIGGTITAECLSSDFVFYGIGFWVFIWKNGSHISVSNSSILEDTVKKIGSLSKRKSQIVIDSFDIEAVACYTTTVLTRQYGLMYKASVSLVIKSKYDLYTIAVVTALCSTVVIILLIFWRFKMKKWFLSDDEELQENINTFFEGYRSSVVNYCNVCDEAERVPYDRKFEISMQNLIIDWESPLGSGAFGFVLKGSLKFGSNYSNVGDVPAGKKTVAVKTIRETSNSQFLTALMSELKVMIYIGKHDNVVNLIGACTENLTQRRLFIILELCKHGSLHNYLMDNSSNFQSTLSKDACMTNEQFQSLYYNINLSQGKLTTVNLFRWGRQILSGMEYLASKKIIHGDLACRNVLLDEYFTAKISDFGLSRRLYERSEYKKKSKEPLPWRWLAIESLRDLIFSTESDVWSFGVTLWEIFSLAHVPYTGVAYSDSFVQKLQNNFRLQKPKYAPKKLYQDVMLPCWDIRADQRPTFKDLGETFDKMMNSIEIS